MVVVVLGYIQVGFCHRSNLFNFPLKMLDQYLSQTIIGIKNQAVNCDIILFCVHSIFCIVTYHVSLGISSLKL